MNFIKNAFNQLRISNSFARNHTVARQRCISNNFHTVPTSVVNVLENGIQKNSSLLVPSLINFIPFRSLKVQLRARRRCVDCYLVWKDNRVFNYCKVHPRHKHASIIPKDKERFIVTHRTTGRKRPW